MASHPRAPGLATAATIHGYTTAFAWAAGILGLGLLLALLVLPSKAGARLAPPLGAAEKHAPIADGPAAHATPTSRPGPAATSPWR